MQMNTTASVVSNVSRPQIVFLDTNVILDCLENRHEEVKEIVSQLFLLHEKGKIVLATSIFNIAELLDKEFEIHFLANLLAQRFASDEILSRKGDRKLYRELSEQHKDRIEEKVNKFIFKKGVSILAPKFEATEEDSKDYSDLYNLIYKYQLQSQDAVIVITAFQNDVTYFLSNDSHLVNQLNEEGIIDAYNLRDSRDRDEFKNNVLNSLAEVLT